MNTLRITKPVAVLVLAGAAVAVGIGAYLVLPMFDQGDQLPRYFIEFQEPQRESFTVGREFTIMQTIRTSTPPLTEYVGEWQEGSQEPYQAAWQLEGEYETSGPLEIQSGREVVAELPEVTRPPRQSPLEGIFTSNLYVTCTEPGEGRIAFSYTTSRGGERADSENMAVMEVACTE